MPNDASCGSGSDRVRGSRRRLRVGCRRRFVVALRPARSVRRDRGAERSDHDVGRRRPERGDPPSRRARTLPGRGVGNALQRRQRHRRRCERLLRGARLRARGRRRPGYRQLRRHLGRPRPARAARRLRDRGVGGAPAVERRQGRHVRRVLPGDHAALHRRAAPAAPEGDLPDPADGRRLPRHGLPRRPEQRRLHPVLARPRLGQRADPAVVRAQRQPGRPGPRARDAGVACAQLPRLRRELRARRDGGRRRLRRAAVEDLVADRGRRQGHGADVHRRRPPRHLPAR